MNSRTTNTSACALARPLAPEDVRRGDYVSILDEVLEFPSFCWFGGTGETHPEDLIRIRMKSDEAGIPFRVAAVCLPFVSLHTAQGQIRVQDLRRVQLVRLSRDYGKSVWKALRKQSPSGSNLC